MKAKIHNFLIGVGSIFNIAPAINLRAFGARKTASERMAQHFENVGKSLSAACNQYQPNVGVLVVAGLKGLPTSIRLTAVKYFDHSRFIISYNCFEIA
jgi:hypothetical protein